MVERHRPRWQLRQKDSVFSNDKAAEVAIQVALNSMSDLFQLSANVIDDAASEIVDLTGEDLNVVYSRLFHGVRGEWAQTLNVIAACANILKPDDDND